MKPRFEFWLHHKLNEFEQIIEFLAPHKIIKVVKFSKHQFINL